MCVRKRERVQRECVSVGVREIERERGRVEESGEEREGRYVDVGVCEREGGCVCV